MSKKNIQMQVLGTNGYDEIYPIPAGHASSHATGGSDAITPTDIGAVPTSRTVNGKALSTNITLSASDVSARPSSWTPSASDVGLGNVGNFKAVSTVASQGLTDTEKSNARANIGAGTSSLTIGTTASTAAAGNHTHTAANVGAVPTSRTVNGKALSADIKLAASDVSAVPTSRTVNGKALSSNITLSASDVGAATMAQVNSAIQTAIGNAIGGSY